MITIAVAQQKGGTAKTTTAEVIGAGLARRGARVLMLDLDPQANISLSAKASKGTADSMDIMEGTAKPAEAIQKLAEFDIVAGSAKLAAADLRLTDTDKAFRLKAALDAVADQYDYAVIDTQPALGLLTANAFTAADWVVIPCLADVFSIQGTAGIAKTISGIKANTNPRIAIAGILVTRYNPRQLITRGAVKLLEDTAQKIGARLFTAKIRECVAVREAQIKRQGLFEYAPKSAAAQDYAAFMEELAKVIGAPSLPAKAPKAPKARKK